MYASEEAKAEREAWPEKTTGEGLRRVEGMKYEEEGGGRREEGGGRREEGGGRRRETSMQPLQGWGVVLVIVVLL
jgi:hypothetical protein